MSSVIPLTEDQRDAVQELLNISMGQAANSLARECKNICVSGILNLLKGMQNANIRQTYRSAS